MKNSSIDETRRRRQTGISLAGTLLLALVVAAPSLAWSQGPVYGAIVVLKDRRAGFLEDVRRLSHEVSVVRGGVEEPAAPGMTLAPGDALRTAEGAVVVESLGGLRVEVGEHSQVRLQPVLLQRLGEIVYSGSGAREVQVGDTTIRAESGTFKVSSGLDGTGNLSAVEGAATIEGGGGAVEVAEGATLDFTEAPGAPRSMTSDERQGLATWRRDRFEIARIEGLHRNRVQLRLDGGLALVDSFTWGRVGLGARIRTIGPLWIDVGGAVAARPTDELPDWRTAIVAPLHLGVRLVADLPGSAFLGGGADFTLLLGQRCSSAEACQRVLEAEPGAQLAVLGGLLLARGVGVDLELGGGIRRQRLPPALSGGDPTDLPDPQLRVSVGLFARF